MNTLKRHLKTAIAVQTNRVEEKLKSHKVLLNCRIGNNDNDSDGDEDNDNDNDNESEELSLLTAVKIEQFY